MKEMCVTLYETPGPQFCVSLQDSNFVETASVTKSFNEENYSHNYSHIWMSQKSPRIYSVIPSL